MEIVIKKVWLNKGNNQKLVTIPKECSIKEGDYVEIKKVGDIWKDPEEAKN